MKETSIYRGIAFTGLEKVAVYGITFVQGVVLARLLSPDDFGLTAMLGIFLGLGGALADSGLGTALVVFNAEGLRKKVLFWNVGIAVAMYLVLAIAAPGIAAWYEKPILAPLMWVMAVGMVINAASCVATASLTKAQKFGRLAWANGTSAIVSAGVAICLAWKGWGVWSIVWMGLVGAVVRTGMMWLFSCSRAEQVRCGEEKRFWQLLSYGLKLTASGIIHVIYTESYNLIIGKMWSPAAVGLFVRGKRWSELPGEVVNEAVGRVALPELAKSWGGLKGESAPGRFLMLNAVLLWPCLAVLGIWAPDIVGLVLGEKWLDCVPYLRILLVGQFFWVFGNVALVKIRASGHAEVVLKTDAWKKPIGIAALVCCIPFGVRGLCWAFVANAVADAVIDVVYALRLKTVDWHG